MSEFFYQPIFTHLGQARDFRKLTSEHVRLERIGSREALFVEPQALTLLARAAFDDVSHLFRKRHLEQIHSILEDKQASDNDKFVASQLLKNAVISAEREFPSCQDTGTAIVLGKRGELVLTGGEDEEHISRGIFEAFSQRNLRYSQLAPLDMFKEKNTGSNLPAQVEIMATKGNTYEFLFIAKGGGSANKSFLYQKTAALLNLESFEKFFRETARSLGTAACPPYHLAIVVGGLSAEMNLKVVKLASCGELDDLPTEGNIHGQAFRDLELEKKCLQWAQETGIGAQFGGKYFAHDVRVIRLPRHGASCPVGVGVSCSADRQIKGKITPDGVFLEQLEEHPEQFLPSSSDYVEQGGVSIDLNQPIRDICRTLSHYPVSTRIMLNGPLIVARDLAHARLYKMLKEGKPLPDYFRNNPVYYAGPAKTPLNRPSGSFGPTTSQRMDPYVYEFQASGASLVMLGKGNRAPEVTEACAAHGGFYLGSIGGPAALLGRDCIKKVEVLDFADLGMEAVWKIEVQDFPAFIIIDDKGNDFFRPSSDVVKKIG